MGWARTSRQSRGYGRDHEKMREELLRTVMLCEECTQQGRTTPGTHADHIVSKAKAAPMSARIISFCAPPATR